MVSTDVLNKYIVRVIIPNGRNKTIQDEHVLATSHHIDEQNNLTFYNYSIYADSPFLVYHSYNWLSFEMRSLES